MSLSESKFTDRLDAAEKLAASAQLAKHKDNTTAVVIGVPPGGVLMAQVVARNLRLPMDIIVAPTKGFPGSNHYSASGNDLDEGNWSPRFLQRGSSHYGWTDASPIAVNQVENAEQNKADSTSARYRGSVPPLNLQGKTVIMVDEALIMPNSLNSALLQLRVLGVEHIIVAVPIGSPLAIEGIRAEVHDVLCLCQRADFHELRQRFADLPLVSDEEVIKCMREEGDRRRELLRLTPISTQPAH